MKPLTVASSLVLLSLLGSRATGQSPTDADAIAAIEQQIAKAWVGGDQATIDRILAAEWSVTDASGRVLTKQQVMEETFGSADRKIEAMNIDDVKVRLYGDTAVATGRTQAKGSYRGASASVVLRFTDVFVRRDGQWQAVASHASLIPPNP
jgi:ketosteroid isomerase-like protein